MRRALRNGGGYAEVYARSDRGHVPSAPGADHHPAATTFTEQTWFVIAPSCFPETVTVTATYHAVYNGNSIVASFTNATAIGDTTGTRYHVTFSYNGMLPIHGGIVVGNLHIVITGPGRMLVVSVITTVFNANGGVDFQSEVNRCVA